MSSGKWRPFCLSLNVIIYFLFAGEFPVISPQDGGVIASFGSIFIYETLYTLIDVSFNSLIPGRCSSNVRSAIFQRNLWFDLLSSCYEIIVRWMSQNPLDDKLTLV